MELTPLLFKTVDYEDHSYETDDEDDDFDYWSRVEQEYFKYLLYLDETPDDIHVDIPEVQEVESDYEDWSDDDSYDGDDEKFES